MPNAFLNVRSSLLLVFNRLGYVAVIKIREALLTLAVCLSFLLVHGGWGVQGPVLSVNKP
jgi:hypothetical protein